MHMDAQPFSSQDACDQADLLTSELFTNGLLRGPDLFAVVRTGAAELTRNDESGRDAKPGGAHHLPSLPMR